MKKLMIAAIIAVASVAANAASCSWMAMEVAGYNGGDVDSIYGFESTKISQQELLSAFGTDGWSAALAKGEMGMYDSGMAMGEVTGYDASTQTNPYLLIVSGDNIFISDVAADAGMTGAKGQDTAANFDFTSTISKDFGGATTYSGEGWYGAVPEPTSGLLLLLGVAGLALRRRRA